MDGIRTTMERIEHKNGSPSQTDNMTLWQFCAVECGMPTAMAMAMAKTEQIDKLYSKLEMR